MNKNINLIEILKNCPKGTRFFSYIHGQVEFSHIYLNAPHPIYVKARTKFGTLAHETFSEKVLYDKSYNGICTLVSSLEQPDWSKWKCPKPKFDPKTLQPFESVLIFNYAHKYWTCDYYLHVIDEYVDKDGEFPYVCVGDASDRIIPYNEDTKHLVGTYDEAPEYYRYWED